MSETSPSRVPTGDICCPRCSLTVPSSATTLAGVLFGVRRADKLRSQSWCNACRSAFRLSVDPFSIVGLEMALRSRANRARRLKVNLEIIAAECGFKMTDRGRYGKAVERVLGLDGNRSERMHQIEVKSVPCRPDARPCEILCVCVANVDPIEKLRRKLFVLFSRADKCVQDVRIFSMDPDTKARLERDVARKSSGASMKGCESLFLHRKGRTRGWYARPSFVATVSTPFR